jgi:hypothetical protein
MDKVDALIFIDANQYLDFYQLKSGRKLLDLLVEQQKYIFVTKQVVDEVERNKLRVAERCLTERLEQLEKGIAIPDYLFAVSKDSAARLRDKLSDASQAIKGLRKIAIQTLEQITRSEDTVSKALVELFSKAILHTSEEIECARDRKERGNPPGKEENPLGDELTWEQLLNYCQGKSRLWIISKDRDYYSSYTGKAFLSPLLYQDLKRRHPQIQQVFCFKNLSDGLKHFVKTAKVLAKKLPPQEELQKIKEEQDSLPPLGWLSTMNYPNYPARQSHAQQYSFFHPGVMGWHPGMQPDPDNP